MMCLALCSRYAEMRATKYWEFAAAATTDAAATATA